MAAEALARTPLTSQLCIYGGVFCKIYTVPENDSLVPQHAHHFDHLTMIVSGAVRVFMGDKSDMRLLGEFRAPAMVKIPAHRFHHFLTLEPNTSFACIHALHAIDATEPDIEAENEVFAGG
jgi:hypothetical protein